MNSLQAGKPAGPATNVRSTARWFGIFALAMGVLLLPLAGAQDSAFWGGSCAVAGNGPGGGGPGDGGPGDGGGNAGSGKGGSKGGGKSDKGDLFGDMIYISRDEDGLPLVDGEGCTDPIAFDGSAWVDLPLFHEIGIDPTIEQAENMEAVPDLCLADEYALESAGVRLRKRERVKDPAGEYCCDQDQDQDRDRLRDRDRIHEHLLQLWQLHRYGTGAPAWDSTLDSDDGELGACDVITVCANNTQEVDLGRLSVLRAPERVLDKSRDEVIKVLLKSSGPDSVTLDTTGRLMVDGATFDSPLVNLALYREFHRFWQLQDTNATPNAYFVPGTNNGLYNGDFSANYGAYIAMAFGLAGGADKAGSGVDMDVVSRVNAIVHLPQNEYLANEPGGFPGTLSRQIEGQWQYFINYRDFDYVREDVWTGCITFDYYDEIEGWVEDYSMNVIDILYPDGLEGAVPQPGDTVNNIGGFALAANDARRILAFVHDIGDDQLRGRVDAVFERTEAWCPEDL